MKRMIFSMIYDRNGNKVKCKSISITNLFCESVLDMDTAKRIFYKYLDNPQEFKTNYPYPAVSISDPLWQQNLPGNSWGFLFAGTCSTSDIEMDG